MKTQLLEDIDDSGALPPRPRPAVWHRPRFDAAPAAPLAGDVEPDPVHMEPEPAAAGAQRPASAPRPETVTATMDPPDWLAEILRQDAEDAAASRRRPAWLPRLLVWGAAACAMALLAGAGLWLFEERRAEAALTVVAAASPAPAVAAQRTMPAVAPAPLAAPAGSAAAIAAPVTAAPVILPAVPVAPVAAMQPAAQEAPAAQADEPSTTHVGRRERAPDRQVASSKARAKRDIGEQRRREETLVQCQAHGYDERQCVQRGCELTRYGLACRG